MDRRKSYNWAQMAHVAQRTTLVARRRGDTLSAFLARQHRFATRQHEATARFAFAQCAQLGHPTSSSAVRFLAFAEDTVSNAVVAVGGDLSITRSSVSVSAITKQEKQSFYIGNREFSDRAMEKRNLETEIWACRNNSQKQFRWLYIVNSTD